MKNETTLSYEKAPDGQNFCKNQGFSVYPFLTSIPGKTEAGCCSKRYLY
jgi:hypothetical protein